MRSTVLLVRHADAGLPQAGGPDDYHRALTPAGRDSARRLTPALLALGPVAVASSPYLRAAQTVSLIAQAAGLARPHGSGAPGMGLGYPADAGPCAVVRPELGAPADGAAGW